MKVCFTNVFDSDDGIKYDRNEYNILRYFIVPIASRFIIQSDKRLIKKKKL